MCRRDTFAIGCSKIYLLNSAAALSAEADSGWKMRLFTRPWSFDGRTREKGSGNRIVRGGSRGYGFHRVVFERRVIDALRCCGRTYAHGTIAHRNAATNA